MPEENQESLEETLDNFEPLSSSGTNDLAALFPDAVEVDGNNYRITKTIKLTEDIVLKPGNYQLSQGCEIRAKDCKLTIQPGTTIKFGNKSGIDVNGGEFHAVGTKKEKIQFLPGAGNTGSKITLNNVMESNLEYCVIRNLKGLNATIPGYDAKSTTPLILVNSETQFKNCEIKGNSSESWGGGIYIFKGSANFDDCQITDNTAGSHGGGIYAEESRVDLKGTVVLRNHAGENGGGVYIDQASIVAFEDCLIERNIAKEGSGAGICIDEKGSAIFEICQIIGNTAGEYGGAIHVEEGSATFNNSKIKRNISNKSGGGISVAFDGLAVLNGCQITNNSTVDSGGGIYVWSNNSITLDDRCSVKGNSEPQLYSMIGSSTSFSPIIKMGLLNRTKGYLSDNDGSLKSAAKYSAIALGTAAVLVGFGYGGYHVSINSELFGEKAGIGGLTGEILSSLAGAGIGYICSERGGETIRVPAFSVLGGVGGFIAGAVGSLLTYTISQPIFKGFPVEHEWVSGIVGGVAGPLALTFALMTLFSGGSKE